MRQVRVTAVNGRKVQANGKWLTSIGNRAVSVGDLVWTDGKCVYGNSSEGGGSSVIIGSHGDELPLLIGKSGSSEGNQYGTYSVKKGIKVIGSGETHNGMINTKSRFALVDYGDGSYWLDVNMDSEGNMYQADRGYATYFHGSEIVDEEDAGILVNGSRVSSIDVQSYMEDVKAFAESRVGNAGEGDCASSSINGKIFSADDYWLIVHAVGTAHKSIDYYPYLTPGSLTCYVVRRWLVTPSGRTLIYEESVYCHGWPLPYWKWDCEIDYSPPEIAEVRLPLGDGYYYILGGNPTPSISIHPHDGVGVFFLQYGGYTAYVYSPDDRLIAILSKETIGRAVNAIDHISLCKLGGNRYIIAIKAHGLYIVQDGTITPLDTTTHNWRLRPLRNIKSWKVQEG